MSYLPFLDPIHENFSITPTAIEVFNNCLLLAIQSQCHVYKNNDSIKLLTKFQTTLLNGNTTKFMTAGQNDVCIYDIKYELVNHYTQNDTIIAISCHPYLGLYASATKSELVVYNGNNNTVKLKLNTITQVEWTCNGEYILCCTQFKCMVLHQNGDVYYEYQLSAPLYAITSYTHHIENELYVAAASLKKELLLSPLQHSNKLLSIPCAAFAICYYNKLFIIGGLNGILYILNYEGVYLEQYQLKYPIHSIKISESTLYVGHTNGYNVFKLIDSTLESIFHQLHFQVDKTDVIIDNKMRIRCRHVIKSVSFNKQYLLIHVNHKCIIYSYSSKNQLFSLKLVIQIPPSEQVQLATCIYVYTLENRLIQYSIDGQLMLEIPIKLNLFNAPDYTTDVLYYTLENTLYEYNLTHCLTRTVINFDFPVQSITSSLNCLCVYLTNKSLCLVIDDKIQQTIADVLDYSLNQTISKLYIQTAKSNYILDYNTNTFNEILKKGKVLSYEGPYLYFKDQEPLEIDFDFDSSSTDDLEFDDYIALYKSTNNTAKLDELYADFGIAESIKFTSVIPPTSFEQQLLEYCENDQYDQAYELINKQPLSIKENMKKFINEAQRNILYKRRHFHLMTPQQLSSLFIDNLYCLQDIVPISYYLNSPYTLLYHSYSICFSYKHHKYCHFSLETILNASIIAFNSRRLIQKVITPIKLATILFVMGKVARQLKFYSTSTAAFHMALKLNLNEQDKLYINRCLLLQTTKSGSVSLKCFICQHDLNLFKLDIVNNCVRCTCGCHFAINKSTLEVMPLLLLHNEGYVEQICDTSLSVDLLIKQQCKVTKQDKIHFKYIVEASKLYYRLQDVELMICTNCKELFDHTIEIDRLMNKKCIWCSQ